MSQYVEELNRLKERKTHLAKEIKDQWRTPEWLFQAINSLYGPIVLDLFTDGQNSKCPRYYTAEDNALTQPWAERLAEIQLDLLGHPGFDDMYSIQGKAFANPPYSIARVGEQPLTGMSHIMEKAAVERAKGASTVFLTKTATADGWWPNETATLIIHIKGRIGFETPTWFNADEKSSKVTSAGFGASIILFDADYDGQYPDEYITREELMEIGMPLASVTQAERDEWIKLWDEI